ncbi:MAG: HNH endonuclease [Rhodanobacter sp.]|jgi:hypothetical protein|nr:HNH endonuclease [Rhodanobacter sp.]
MTIATKENRDSAEFAASLMEALCPSPRDRTLVLRQLLESINLAEKISPDVWAVTLFEHGFRLNVGPVEVMTFTKTFDLQNDGTIVSDIMLRLLLHGQIGEDIHAVLTKDEEAHSISPSNYKSVPQPQFIYAGFGEISSGSLSEKDFRELEAALKLLQPLHANFIVQATKTPSGGVRKSSSFRRSHSPGLYSYAQSFVDGNWEGSHEQEMTILVEGDPYSIQAIVYERNPIARQKCISHYGDSCSVCGFNFGITYGSAAQNYIHVHHLKPMASIGKEYVIDPINDLRPVCANCHAVIHLRKSLYTIEEVKNMLHGGVNA